MLMLVAFALRVYAIADTPPGLTHDEVASLEVSSRIQHGDWRVFYGEDYGVEPAYYYVLALFRTIFGDNMLAWRLPAVVGGLLGLAAIYVLTVRLFGRGVGLIALAVAAVTWWSVIMSRVILREMWEVFWYALAIYGFWRGFEPAVQSTQTARLRPMIFGGIALGVAQYVHTIPRGLFGVFVLFGFYLVFFHRSVFKRSWRGIVALIIFAELIAIPVLVTDTSVGTSVFQTADETPVVSHLLAATERYIGQFFWQGDAAWEFNVPLRPIFDPLGALFLGLGLLIILARISRPTHALTFFAWAVTLVPGILFDAHYPFPRSVTAQVTTFALVGLGVQASVRGLERIRLPRAQAIAVLTIGAWLIWNVARTGYDMFSIWPTVGDVRSGYHMEQRDLGRYLATHSSILPVSQCTLWVIFPGDPQYHQSIPHEAAAYFMPNTTDIRWHDCRYSLVIPAGGQFIFAHPDLEPLESFLGRGLKKPWLDNAQPVPGVSGALQVDARTALQNQLAEWQTLPIGWPPEASITTTAALPIDFNHAVELLGYQIKPPLVKPGATVRVITYWRVIGDLPSDLIAFTHLYRTPSEVVAQQDQLDVDGSSLHPGDVFMQSHEFIVVPADSSAGAYTIGVGLYRKGTGDRWPIYVGAQRVADRLFLDQIQVKP
ncbi:MAG: glycosyltransferase family 39 protein [Anaerolineae bacterium]